MTSATSTDRRYGVAEGMAMKVPCRLATTGDQVLSGLAAIDGITPAEGDRILVWQNTDQTTNGMYNASSGNWQRALDVNGARDVVKGTRVFVTSGDEFGGREFVLTTDNTIIIGTSELNFEHFAGDVSASIGIYETNSAVEGVSIPLEFNAIIVKGYARGGDGGHGLYARVDAEPSHPGKIQSDDGAWWELVPGDGGINVKSLGATDDGIDCSAAILRAVQVAAGNARVYFPRAATSFKFSVTLDEDDATEFCGEGYGSTLVPLGVSQPCFKLGYTAAFPPFLKYKFRRLRFADPGTKTCAAIWSAYAAEVTDCFFENLKYASIYNSGEWPRYSYCYIAGCRFGIYATAANASHDPLGFTSGTFNSNPSEKYFDHIWFNNNECDYYEEQPDNSFDRTSFVRFKSCVSVNGNANFVVLDCYNGRIVLEDHWFEGRTGSEPGITVRGKSIPSSIMYSEGCSVQLLNTNGVYTANPIFVKLSAYNSANVNPPRFDLDGTDIQNGCAITLDPGVVSSLKNASAFGNGGVDLSIFSIVDNVVPQLPLTNSGIIFPARVLPVTALQGSASGPYLNLWTKGSCMGAASNFFGTPTSATITAGDGFICSAFGVNKYLAVVGCHDTEGPHSNVFTSVTGKIYLLSFGIRQVSGSSKSFRIYPAGVTNGPNQFSTVNVKSGGWRFFIGISGCQTGAASQGNVAIVNNSGGDLDFDISAIQVIQFDTIEQAIVYANSGIYTLPVVL